MSVHVPVHTKGPLRHLYLFSLFWKGELRLSGCAGSWVLGNLWSSVLLLVCQVLYQWRQPPSILLFWLFCCCYCLRQDPYVAQTGLELMIFLPWPLRAMVPISLKCAQSCLAFFLPNLNNGIPNNCFNFYVSLELLSIFTEDLKTNLLYAFRHSYFIYLSV